MLFNGDAIPKTEKIDAMMDEDADEAIPIYGLDRKIMRSYVSWADFATERHRNDTEEIVDDHDDLVEILERTVRNNESLDLQNLLWNNLEATHEALSILDDKRLQRLESKPRKICITCLRANAQMTA